ncbi:DUF169 domain-containing protein [bacterium]|nr:DUF169 domain-containing protein [bacterium]
MKFEKSNPTHLNQILNLNTPLIGFYDAPNPQPFQPLVEPHKKDCIFSFYQRWIQGETLHLTKDNFGCGGAGHWILGIKSRSKEDYIRFLGDEEGLKASPQLMEQWIDSSHPYHPQHSHILIGPLNQNQWTYLQSIMFFVDPDQLSTLMCGAQHHSSPQDPPPVIAPFGSGCMEIRPFQNPDIPQAAIGATDLAMRQHLPAHILAFTVTKPMFRRLCELDKRSFLYKSFFQNLKKTRGINHFGNP